MGNRAVITTEDERIGVYIHWSGDPASVQAFLTACKNKGYRPPEKDNYGWGGLCKVICDKGLNCGVDTLDRLDCDNGDNGMYIIKDWNVIGRKYV